MMKESIDLSMIAGTLKYGAFSGESRKKIFGALLAFASVMIIAVIFMIVVLSIEQYKKPDNIEQFIFVLTVSIVAFLVPVIVLLYFVLYNEKSRKDILLWLVDAVELKAYSRKIGTDHALFPSVKIQVEFEFEGQQYFHTSQGRYAGQLSEGYHSVWSKYADKTIHILYSKSYDQVIVLKNPKGF